MTKLEETIRDEIIEKLEDIEEIDDDLAYPERLMTRFIARTIIDNAWGKDKEELTREAIQWIKENFEDLVDYVEEYEIEYGVYINPFSNPERFQVIMTRFIARTIIDNAWGKDKEELIANLKEE